MVYLYYVLCVALSECVPASVWYPVVLEHFVCGMFWCFMHELYIPDLRHVGVM